MNRPFSVIARLLGIVCVVVSLAWSQDLFTLAGSRGIAGSFLGQQTTGNLPLSLHQLIRPSPAFDRALLALCWALACFGAALFWRPRSPIVAAALYLTEVSFKQTVPLMAYGVYEFLQIGLFYVLIANLAGWYFRRDGARQWKAERTVGWFFRAHLAMGYLFAGLSKAVGPHWWSGDSMWRALGRSDDGGQRWLSIDWSQYPLFLQAAGIATVLLELSYPLAFVLSLRRWIIGGIIVMHFGTIATQGLTIFGITMIALNVFFLLESAAANNADVRSGFAISGYGRSHAPQCVYAHAHLIVLAMQRRTASWLARVKRNHCVKE